MGLGLAVTWDNPDIVLLEQGAPVPSSDLRPDTEYEIAARIWNGSPDAPVIGLPVHFTVHGFGIGTAGLPIASTAVDLGVLGGPGCPATATVKWRTPAAAGHYCLRATIDWADDANPSNNVGQENTDVAIAASPARTQFELRNDDPERRRAFRLEADAYTLPVQEECDPEGRSKDQDPGDRTLRRQALGRGQVAAETRRRHDRQAHPLPEGWSVEIVPNHPQLDPGQEQTIEVVVTPPDGFVGEQVVNVNAFHEDGLAGGVSLLVRHA